MPSKHKAGGCNCCGACVSNDTARINLLAALGISTITASGGPVVSTTTPDYKTLTCAPSYPSGSDPSYPSFDFSGSTSSAISATPAGAGYIACPPNYIRASQFPLGALEYACISTVPNARGFASRSGSDCADSTGSLLLDYFASFRASVVFTCTAGVSSYVLGVGTSVLIFVINPSSYFSSLPTSGTDWTRTGSGLTGTFTKNGSTATSGAAIDFTFVSSISGGSIYNMSASTWVSNPTTSVTMWVPNPTIDWTGLTVSGTAALS